MTGSFLPVGFPSNNAGKKYCPKPFSLPELGAVNTVDLPLPEFQGNSNSKTSQLAPGDSNRALQALAARGRFFGLAASIFFSRCSVPVRTSRELGPQIREPLLG